MKTILKRISAGMLAVVFLATFAMPRSRAVAVIDDIAVGSMSCEAFLASIGLPLTATGGASAVTSGVVAASGEYAAATGAAASGEAFLGTVAAGTAVSTAGAIVLTAAAAAALGAFAYWLYDTYSLDTVEGAVPINTQKGLLLADGRVLPNGQFKFIHGNQVADSAGNLVANSSYILLDMSDSETDVITFTFPEKTAKFQRKYSSAYGYTNYCWWDGETKKYSASWPVGILNVAGNLCFCFFTGSLWAAIGNQSFVSVSDAGTSFVDNSLSITNSDFQSIPDEFPNTKRMALNVGASPGTTLDELAQSVPEQVANNTLNVTYTIVSSGESSGSGTPEINPNPDVEAPDDVTPYTVKIGEVFPFCIPFDLYHMVTMFDAEPEAPHAKWEFSLPWSPQEQYKVEWDLKEFDTLAELCRKLELVLFCVGLAVVTSKLIKW